MSDKKTGNKSNADTDLLGSRLDKIEEKIDDIRDKATDTKVSMAKIETTLSAQHDSLQAHMKRTQLLEDRVVPLEASAVIVNTIGKVALAILSSGIIFEIVLKLLAAVK